MKFFIKRAARTDFSAFAIFDEKGTEKYFAEFSKSERSRKIIINSETGEAVKIRCLQLSNFIACSINAGGRKMKILMGASHDGLGCMCYGVNWKIRGNAATKCFSIFDVDNSLIASQQKAFCSAETYELNVYSSANELLSISVAVCINMFNTVDNPVRQAV